MTKFIERTALRDLGKDEQPREKLGRRGAGAMANAELIALIIGSGLPGRSVVEVARDVLRANENDLHLLARRSVTDLLSTPGIGRVKAMQIVAALELGRRREAAPYRRRTLLDNSENCFRYLRPLIGDLEHEEFYVLCLNQAQELLGCHRVSQGGTTGTVADARTIFRTALGHGSVTGLILAHNHPSGQAFPSATDVALTRKLSRAALHLDLRVLDHLIVTGNRYYSFADEQGLDE